MAIPNSSSGLSATSAQSANRSGAPPDASLNSAEPSVCGPAVWRLVAAIASSASCPLQVAAQPWAGCQSGPRLGSKIMAFGSRNAGERRFRRRPLTRRRSSPTCAAGNSLWQRKGIAISLQNDALQETSTTGAHIILLESAFLSLKVNRFPAAQLRRRVFLASN